MKKIVVLLLCVLMCGCGLTSFLPHSSSSVNENSSLNQIESCASDLFDKLMDTRLEIRQSNIYIETKMINNWGVVMATSLGSGVVYKSDATSYYALTNYHVIDPENATRVQYSVSDLAGNIYEGKIIKSSSLNDLAIVSFAKNLTAAEIPLINIEARKNIPLDNNEFLFAVGNPNGVKNNVTFGEFQGMSRIANVSYEVIHHNVLINPGNSGGALCDIDGNLVGLNTWGSKNIDDDNFAIPLSIIYAFIES